ETVEEDAGHHVVVVLAGVDKHLLVTRAQRPAHGGGLDELRARPDHGHDLHQAATSAGASAPCGPRPSVATAATRQSITRRCCAHDSPGNIGSDRISEAARSATGKSPGPTGTPG